MTVLPQPQCQGCFQPSFGPAPVALHAAGRAGIVTGDFNGDGIPDFAVGGVTVFPGTGAGTFGPPVTTAGPWSSQSVIAADFDRDGALDILSFSSGSGFSVQLGRGDGSFEAPTSYTVVNAVAATVDDFNEDGFPDVAVARRSPNEVRVFFGSATGAMTAGPVLALSGNPAAIASGVLRPGSHGGIVVAQTEPNSLGVFRGDGSGSFAPGPALSLVDRPLVIAISDLDDDGQSDLAVSTASEDPQLLLYGGNSDGSFSLRRELPVNATRLRIADVDGDGHKDLVFLEWTRLGVLFGKGDWSFGDYRSVHVGIDALDFDVADFDADGRMDAAVTNDQITTPYVAIFRGDSRGFEEAPAPLATPSPGSLLARDFNGDGRPDLAVADSSPIPDRPVSVLLNDGLGGFLPLAMLEGTQGGKVFASEDLNGDGRADLVVSAGGQPSRLSGCLRRGPRVVPDDSHVSANSISIADFNGDGKRDLAVVTPSGVMILAGNGLGGFSSNGPAPGLSSATSLAVGDFNGDGKPDLFIDQTVYPWTALAFGKGDGTFLPPVSVTLPAGLSGQAVGDLNGDGRDDVVSPNPPYGLAIFLSNGNGFDAPINTAPSNWVTSTAIADFNGDGHKDIAMTGLEDERVTILLSDGKGQFLSSADLVAGRGARSLAVADFDGDGRQDIAAGNVYDGTVSIFQNTNCVPRRLTVAGPSSCLPPGSSLAPQPTATIVDDGGNALACAVGDVTASLQEGTGISGAGLLGNRTVSPVNGIAVFPDLADQPRGEGLPSRVSASRRSFRPHRPVLGGESAAAARRRERRPDLRAR